MDINIDLNEVRNEINQLDKEIVLLLEKRFNAVLNVAMYKKINNMPILDEDREKAVIEKCKGYLSGKKYEDYLENIYVEVMNNCKEIQKNEIKVL